jgi:hypothetical protein
LGYNAHVHGKIQGNSLYRYLKQMIMSMFSFFKVEELKKGGAGPVWMGVAGTSCGGEEVGKGCGRVNIV